MAAAQYIDNIDIQLAVFREISPFRCHQIWTHSFHKNFWR